MGRKLTTSNKEKTADRFEGLLTDLLDEAKAKLRKADYEELLDYLDDEIAIRLELVPTQEMSQ